ncbi:ester cyclase [Streptomyces sp. NPDC005963]|uniref:ester cyclase n=1 Tax=Streptomyces sp. NPDC005963 TaxID=3156721 RepID=UPI0033FFBD86
MTGRLPLPQGSVATLVTDRSEPRHTQQERDNLDLIRRYRSAVFAERASFLKPGATVTRIGMKTLSETSGLGRHGYLADSLSDRRDEITDIIAKGDMVWAVWTLRARHTGVLFGMPPTGRSIAIVEMAMWRIEDHRIAEHWYFADELDLLRQLGALPRGAALLPPPASQER